MKCISVKIAYLLLCLSFMLVLFGCEKAEDLWDVGDASVEVMGTELLEEDVSVDIASLKKVLMETRVVIRAGNEFVQKSFGEIGFTVRNEEAFYREYEKMVGMNEQVVALRGLELNSYSVRYLIEELGRSFNREAVEPEYMGLYDDVPAWSSAEAGREIDIERTLSLVKSAANGFYGKDIVIDAIVKTNAPKLSDELAEMCRSVIGECEIKCNLETASGKNAKRAMELLNETVLMPGEALSAKSMFAPFSEDNGYVASTGFIDGVVVDSIGGGVCRVVTALYGAVLDADVTVVERHCHTKQVNYVTVSMDATVSSDKDFIIRNDTESPLVIFAKESDEGIYVSLIGREREDADVQVEFIAQVTDVVLQGADTVIISEDVPYMEYTIVEQGREGCRAVLYKYVYDMNGEFLSSERINESFYLPKSSIIVAGIYYKS